MKTKLFALGVSLFAILSLSLASPASALVLTFEGLQDQEEILDFYNGGTGSLGSAGPNYGINFGPDALALIDIDNGGNGNFANEPSPDTIAFWLSGQSLVMNVAAGFDTGFSFFYSSLYDATVTVYDGLGATGNILGQINLVPNYQNNNCTGDPTGDFCNWDAIGVAFAGTAMSVDFSGAANYVGYDNITLGSATPETTVPEPSTLLLLGSGLAGLGLWGRRWFKSN
jgi:hypothetical protein